LNCGAAQAVAMSCSFSSDISGFSLLLQCFVICNNADVDADVDVNANANVDADDRASGCQKRADIE
jgi:hypothetical protein